MTAYAFIAFQKRLQSPFNLFLTFPKYLYAFFLQDKDARRVDWSDKVDQDSLAEEAETESNVWDDRLEDVNPYGGGNPGFHNDHYDNPLLTKETESKPIIWDKRDEEEESKKNTKCVSAASKELTACKENRPPMLMKDNYIPWSSRIIRYARSRPNGKMIVDSIENKPYVRRMIATPGEPDFPVPVPESLHEETYEELTKTDIKRMDADDQAIQTILLGLLEDVNAAVDSCEIAKEIWERVRQMMKRSDIREQEKKAKLFNEWEKFTSTDGESIESYYHRFMQLMNDLKRNKHFPKNIASNLKDECLVKSHDPLALMSHSHNSFNFPTTHKDQSSLGTHPQQSFPINNKYNPQLPLNQNFIQPPMTSLEDINDPTEAMNAALILFAKAFQLSAPTNNNRRTLSNPRNRQIAQLVMNMGQDRQIQNVGGNGRNQFGQYVGQVVQNQQGFNAWQNGGIQGAQNAGVQSGGNQNGLVVIPGIANQSGTGNIVAAMAKGTGIRNQAR
nr:hypothetical protein [Tanacetum cinerariifolium]